MEVSDGKSLATRSTDCVLLKCSWIDRAVERPITPALFESLAIQLSISADWVVCLPYHDDGFRAGHDEENPQERWTRSASMVDWIFRSALVLLRMLVRRLCCCAELSEAVSRGRVREIDETPRSDDKRHLWLGRDIARDHQADGLCLVTRKGRNFWRVNQ